MDVVVEIERTKAFLMIYKRKILYWLIFVRILCIIVSSMTLTSESLFLFNASFFCICEETGCYLSKLINLFVFRLYEVPLLKLGQG